MRMYTIHFGQGREHTVDIDNHSLSNMPVTTPEWQDGLDTVRKATVGNSRIVSHREIFERYGITGGHGEYCLETWTNRGDFIEDTTRLFVTQPVPTTVETNHPMYIKFDFLHTNSSGGDILRIQRQVVDNVPSHDFLLYVRNGILGVKGVHGMDPQSPFEPKFDNISVWENRLAVESNIKLSSDKWHEIQIFVDLCFGWSFPDNSAFGRVHGFGFGPAFEAFRGNGSFKLPTVYLLKLPFNDLNFQSFEDNPHPMYPNVTLPNNPQDIFPPPNFGSGQFIYPENLGHVYVWVDGKLVIQTIMNFNNLSWEETHFGTSFMSLWFGTTVQGSINISSSGGRFFYDNIICNDGKNVSGAYPSKIFDPIFSSDEALEWNPNYKLKFTALEFTERFWKNDFGRNHDYWMPEFPRGALIRSGEPYFVDAPNRRGSHMTSMIPHGTKLTTIHVDWNGDSQDYIANKGNRSLYPDYKVDYAYQQIQPNESNPSEVNKDDPQLTSQISGAKALFYLKRPPATFGKSHLAGGFGLGGPTDYLPNVSRYGDNSLPVIYRIWTYIQDHTIGTAEPIDTQHHMIKVPSGINDYVELISDNQCPGDRGFRAYHNDLASALNGHSMADWPYNPVTKNPWTWDDLEQLQIGVYHATHEPGNTAVVYTMYLVVEHGSDVDPDVEFLGDNILLWNKADSAPFTFGPPIMYYPHKKPKDTGIVDNPNNLFNAWQISPPYTVSRTNTRDESSDKLITGMQFSGVISYPFKPGYLNGERVSDEELNSFDYPYKKLWVFTDATIHLSPKDHIREPYRNEVIKDADGEEFIFFGYPVLEWGSHPSNFTYGFTSPLKNHPFVLYDYTTLYLLPISISPLYWSGRVAKLPDPNKLPVTVGSLGTSWTINSRINSSFWQIDKNSFFEILNTEKVDNYKLTHPDQYVSENVIEPRAGLSSYFIPPNLSSGSVYQTMYLTDVLGLPTEAIDSNFYKLRMGLYQSTIDKSINDTGEGKFEFYDASEILISGHTFGLDNVAGWHLNEIEALLPSGTRSVKFTFTALRNTDDGVVPGGTFGGTSNMAVFDEPFFIVDLSDNALRGDHHPADSDQDNRISTQELAKYTMMWQSGILPLGESKRYLTRAEQIWSSGVSTHFADPSGGRYFNDNKSMSPYNWIGSGNI